MRERRPRLIAALPFTIFVLSSAPLSAQAGLGHVEDASLAPRGLLRLRAISSWTRFDARFTNAGVEPLGALFSSDSLGPGRIPPLASIESLIEAASGEPFSLSLGSTRLDAMGRTEIVPIGLEYGLTNRISVGVIVPFVRRRVAVQFRMDTTGATVGPNLQRSSPVAQQANTQLQAEFANAATQLQNRLQFCRANPGAVGCAALLARESEALQLILASETFAADLEVLYGGATSIGMDFVPLTGSSAQTAVETQVADYNTRYRDLLTATADVIRATPAAAAGPAGSSEFQSYLTQTLGRDSIATQERTGIGDVELGVKALLLDRPVTETRRMGMQLAASIGVRLPTGSRQSPTEITNLALGAGATVVDSRALLDVRLGRAGLLAVGDLGVSASDDSTRDTRSIGVHLAPRWHLSGPLAVHASYSLQSGDISGATQLVGGGVSYSTLADYRASGGPVPIEMRFTHLEAISGASGQPKLYRQQIELRIYFRVRR
jgi:hypothetical protein